MSFNSIIGKWVDRIRINTVVCEAREKGGVWLKCRRRSSRLLIPCANAFFRSVGNPVAVLPTGRQWLAWEVESFQLLNGDDFVARTAEDRSVEMAILPGRSLCSLLDAGVLTAEMLESAGREMRRAHSQFAPHFSGPWSHGDPHLGNFIFDPATGRTRLIDFEVRHYLNLAPDERHLEDLLVPLLDLMGRCPEANWVNFSRRFLAGYNRPGLTASLSARLVPPRGAARFWWAIRTSYLSRDTMRQRLSALRTALEVGV